jgi:hypothetical protein
MLRPIKGEILVPVGKLYPDGAVVVVGYDEQARLMVHPLGGGLQYHLSPEQASSFRSVASGERASALFRRTKVVLADSNEAFEGWTNGELWNGWEKPRFEKAEADRLLQWLQDSSAKYDPARDAYITVSQDGEDEVWAAESIPISDGSSLRVYPIGAGSWIWEEVEQS